MYSKHSTYARGVRNFTLEPSFARHTPREGIAAESVSC